MTSMNVIEANMIIESEQRRLEAIIRTLAESELAVQGLELSLKQLGEARKLLQEVE